MKLKIVMHKNLLTFRDTFVYFVNQFMLRDYLLGPSMLRQIQPWIRMKKKQPKLALATMYM